MQKVKMKLTWLKMIKFRIVLFFIFLILADSGINAQEIYTLSAPQNLHLKTNTFSIPIEFNSSVDNWIKIYSGEKRNVLIRKLERFNRYSGIVKEIFSDNNLPEDLTYLALLSSSNRRIWDFLYSRKIFYLKNDWYRDERKNILKSTMVTAEFLDNGFDESNDWKTVLNDYFRLSRKLSSGEAQTIDEFYALVIIAKNLKTFGFNELEYKAPLDFKEVLVKPFTDIELLAQELGLPADKLAKLNPELKHWFTPPGAKGFYLRIPPKSMKTFKQCCNHLNLSDNFEQIKITEKRSLASVAAIFKVPTYVLADLNHIHTNKILIDGMRIKLPFKKTEGKNFQELYSKLTSPPTLPPSKNVIKKSAKNVKRHKVQRGENLFQIAKRYHTTIRNILSDNKSLKNQTKIFSGHILVIR